MLLLSFPRCICFLSEMVTWFDTLWEEHIHVHFTHTLLVVDLYCSLCRKKRKEKERRDMCITVKIVRLTGKTGYGQKDTSRGLLNRLNQFSTHFFEKYPLSLFLSRFLSFPFYEAMYLEDWFCVPPVKIVSSWCYPGFVPFPSSFSSSFLLILASFTFLFLPLEWFIILYYY